jgi:iron(III) transport system ATP-binding protein
MSDRVAVLDGGVVQQIGTPMALYDDPANRFIAEFVGTINLLPGRVVQDAGGVRFESALVGSIALPLESAPASEAAIAIRPHALVLASADRTGDPARIWLDGIITEREFLGEFVRYTVKVGDTHLVADEMHFVGGAGHVLGRRVKVGINPAQVKLLSG